MASRHVATGMRRLLPTVRGIDSSSSLQQPFCKRHHTLTTRKCLTRPICTTHKILSASFKVGKSAEQKPGLEQVGVPDYETEWKFKGLDTSFPCLTKLPTAGPEPEYHKVVSGYQTFHYPNPFSFKYNASILPKLDIAYETWGEPNEDMSNAVLLFTGLSSSSHAKSHKDNEAPGWWEKFIGPGCAIDTNKFFVICCNHIGGCYGSTGPSSVNPVNGEPYGTTFPLLSVEDMVNAQFLLLDHLGIDKLHAAVGASLGGMCSLLAGAVEPERVGRVISISACVQTHATSISLRFLQRRAIMTDPNWQRGHYYGDSYPKMGMKLAREIATITYRSGPEWQQRFGRDLIDPQEAPSLCPSFQIENYIMHQGETFCNKYDPNSLLYISKAMDMFDMAEGFESLQESVSRVQCPVMVLGAQTDILIPIWQQREMVDLLRGSGNDAIAFYEINSIFGHDTFLLDLSSVGGAIKGHLETELQEKGFVRKSAPKWMEEKN